MALWWITEALPIAATALMPLVLFPLLGVTDIDGAATPYANPLIFLFMGGFIIAQAMRAWNLHRRIALNIVRAVGTSPSSIVVGFILASAFLSMWVSNTATALMMLPIGLSVIELTRDRLKERDRAPHFGVVLLLSVAYACNVGGMGTLIGTPPNAILAGFFSESYGVEVGFAQWMMVGLPLVVVALPLVYMVLTWVYPIELEELPGGTDIIDEERAKLGTISAAEKRVAIVFGATALFWMMRPLLGKVVSGLSDAGIAIGGGLALFLIPAGTEDRALLAWSDAEELPWGVLILFGGGLSLAAAISDTGLAGWIGQGVNALSGWPILTVLVSTVALIVVLTEITSNTATTAAFLPILGAVAVGIGENPFLLAVPAALGASCAFMLPVATPPNAIVYGSDLLTIPEMSRVGVWLNAVFIVVVTLSGYLLLGLAFGVELGIVPSWAAG
jgi:sodium-dependent dicarboxylate transporter 2/3/5